MSEIREITKIVKQMGDVLAGREVSYEEIYEEWNKNNSKDPFLDEVIPKLKKLVSKDSK